MKLAQVCNVTSSKRIFADEYTDSGVPFYRGLEITQKSLGNDINDCLYISNNKFNYIKKKYGVPTKYDLFITAVGTIGSIYQAKGEDFYFKDGNIIWLKNFNKSVICSSFLKYYLQSEYVKKQINNKLIGAVQKALTIDTLSDINIQVPSLNSQLRITNIVRNCI